MPSTVITATPDTMIGGFFWYGGWVVVIVGMFVFGAALRLLDDVIDVTVNPQGTFLILLLFPSLVGGEEDWPSILSAFPATAFVWLLAVALTFPNPSLRAEVILGAPRFDLSLAAGDGVTTRALLLTPSWRYREGNRVDGRQLYTNP